MKGACSAFAIIRMETFKCFSVTSKTVMIRNVKIRLYSQGISVKPYISLKRELRYICLCL